jgi:hypothetical protein
MRDSGSWGDFGTVSEIGTNLPEVPSRVGVMCPRVGLTTLTLDWFSTGFPLSSTMVGCNACEPMLGLSHGPCRYVVTKDGA